MNNENNIQDNTLDFSYIYDVSGGKQDFFLSLLKVISKSLNEYPKKLKASQELEEWDKIRETAHKFKSSISYLGYMNFNEALNEIELSEEKELPTTRIIELIEDVCRYSAESQEGVLAKMAELEGSNKDDNTPPPHTNTTEI